ncbi:macrophage colony-stimulating factor 1a isoform 1-T2 [Clarias gariepinus]|uniref:macrophage colony-stimulating factor 1a n=1 Tax=Clarias gariepinus TaxID=13013 RepID=UPI00234C047A|nr:macrophage colony-stimulating factor 1a [Clarias gariepinus]XP_053339576.1 macrophage colony-stimulating factor 1a [Clarias gariepinus]
MNTHTTTHKAKIRHLCSCLVLCLHLASGSVTGLCEHSVTEEHLLILRKLIMNQVQNGCSITYWFTERQNLSEICYIKAAFPYILVLLNTHFTYEEGSDNYNYTNTLKDMIYNIYSHECIPHINEEIEENPQKFARMYTSLSREGLQKTAEVFQMYKRLMSKSDNPVDWNCQDEYAKNFPESTTATYTQTTGAPDCQCSCQHPLKASSTPTASSTSPSHTQSGAYINKNESFRASEPTVSDEAQNSTPNQIFATPPALEPFTGLHTKSEHFTEQHSLPVHEESANFIISPTPNLIYNSSNSSIAEESEQQSITTSSELPSIPTRTVLQSETSQPSEKNNTTLISDRNPVLVLAKRSLGSREQETPSVTYSKLLWSWIAETKGIRKNTKVKLLEISSEETEHVEHNSPTQPQMHHHIDKPLPGFKNISKEPDCKDLRCQKATEDRSDQRSRNLIKRHLGEKEYQFVNIPTYTMFMTSSACLLLLFTTALFYCRKQIKDLQEEDRTIHL